MERLRCTDKNMQMFDIPRYLHFFYAFGERAISVTLRHFSLVLHLMNDKDKMTQ